LMRTLDSIFRSEVSAPTQDVDKFVG